MIQSAVVFSPQKPTSRELDVAFLQSPVKPYRQSTVKDDRETEVTLVDGDAVVMAEEGKDAFFLEEVDRVGHYIEDLAYCIADGCKLGTRTRTCQALRRLE